MSEFCADTLLVIHFAFIAFVAGGFVLTAVGCFRRWRWVRNVWFRRLHLGAVLLVVVQQWLGVSCPLTVLENSLRAAASEAGYASEPFVAYWLRRLIHYDLPPWVFTLVYTGFGALVAGAWLIVPPEGKTRKRHETEGADFR